ncbi:hypothetical protein SBF1_840046 [Candidatus Desulfosporosinus infrequens]|uniref:Uncharacterized protein n=1 Tax=Candidatus Desulfosporosinus infrequens TaxID=2043169 RepID=A0A2U3LUV5_9FIRM|nr:hypothetical protein SBF1_840046 [Candidatus Desulfosporosinus infrequens]
MKEGLPWNEGKSYEGFLGISTFTPAWSWQLWQYASPPSPFFS